MPIRPAVPSDLEPLARIWHAGWKEAHTGLLPPGLERRRTPASFRERLLADLADVRVAGPPAEPVGFCLVRGDELCQLYIAADARGTGVAAALVADAEQGMRAAGVETAWLACAVGNDRAARFYEKQGWRRAGTVMHEPDDSGGFVLEVWRYETAHVKELAPPPALAPFVDRFWYRAPGEVVGSAEPHRILPDGCLDIVIGPRHAIVVGAMTRPILVPPTDHSALLGVRFRPGMATAFLRIPAADVTDDRAPLDAVWSDGADVADYVGSALATDRAVTRLADALTARLSRIAVVPRDLTAAVDRIMARGGRVDISRLAASLGITRQHLARRFAAHVGVTPKTLSRVMRMREAIRIAAASRVNWAAVAADLGYSDQSHLVAEFRSLTGLTPSRWTAIQRARALQPSPPRGAGTLSRDGRTPRS